MGTDEKSWRNAELLLYPESTTQEELERGLATTTQFAYMLHDKDVAEDGTPKKPHWHVMCSWGKSPRKTSTIAKAFGCKPNQISKIHGRWADAIDYLTHHNAPNKYQYSAELVVSNFDWQEVAANSRANIDKLAREIADGDIREYNLTDHVSVEDYIKHKRKIDTAFAWRKSYVLQHLEEIVSEKRIIWIYGQTGTGKTTLAKQLAKTLRLVFAITSTGRNMFDEYRDEPCLIIDDLRPEDVRFNDLLGILDPYNFKAATARYQNKALQTQAVIVTTTLSPEEFCKRCNGEELNAEDARQLFRRINSVYEVTEKEVIDYVYRDDLSGRDCVQRYPNVWLVDARAKAKKADRSLLQASFEAAMA